MMNPFLFLPVADATPTVVNSSDWQDVITAIQTQISVTTIVEVLAACIGVCIGLVFFWWGVRKVVRMLMTAFKRGKLRI